jgi:hypothetical protein
VLGREKNHTKPIASAAPIQNPVSNFAIGLTPRQRSQCPRERRILHISRANRDRLSAGVARIISTAEAVSIVSFSPFMASTAVTH